jgi:phosphopantothenoylcysteine decarboxylase/phosphopantothenate--cysteine ligase
VEILRQRGHVVLEPAVGRLTGVDSGKGRLPAPSEIYSAALRVLQGRGQDLAGRHIVVSAGGTREFLDPVRFLGNRSSGRQGYALAEAAVARGARVTVVAANVSLPDPAGVELVRVVTTEELRRRVHEAAGDADAVVMAAAPADFRPADFMDAKIKKTPGGAPPQIQLVENPDILAELVAGRSGSTPVIVGFAAETGDAQGTVLDHARTKLARKGCDLLVVNDVSGGKAFGHDDNEAVILGSDGTVHEVGHGPKIDLAHAIWDAVVQRVD